MRSAAKIVLVTGAGGFIGPHIVRALLARGHHVRALMGPRGSAVARLEPRAKAYAADICDGHALGIMMRGVDVVVHAAGPASVRESFEEPSEYARAHVGGTASVLDACRRCGVRRIVYFSSADVYGRPKSNPVSEDAMLQARSPYAAFKIGGEQLVTAYSAAFDVEAAILRPFSIYGPGMSSRSLVGTILDLATRGKPIVLDDLRPVRDYCHVSDLASAVVKSCEATIHGVQAINVGSGKGTSVARLAGLAQLAMGRHLPVRQRSRQSRPAAAEIYRLVADTSRAARILGWEPHVSLRSGLSDLAAHARERRS